MFDYLFGLFALIEFFRVCLVECSLPNCLGNNREVELDFIARILLDLYLVLCLVLRKFRDLCFKVMKLKQVKYRYALLNWLQTHWNQELFHSHQPCFWVALKVSYELVFHKVNLSSCFFHLKVLQEYLIHTTYSCGHFLWKYIAYYRRFFLLNIFCFFFISLKPHAWPIHSLRNHNFWFLKLATFFNYLYCKLDKLAPSSLSSC